jgi:hypothetical protein
MNDGSVHDWSSITAVDGVYQPMASIPPEIAKRPYVQENLAAGRVLAAVTAEGTDLWDDGRVYAVPGFQP